MKRFILFLITLTCGFAYAQPYRIIGRVNDAVDGAALGGVTITVDAAPASTSTGIQGDFTLHVPTLPDTVTFFLLGYHRQRVAVNDRTTTLHIRLEPATALLQEVTVQTGYQSIPKERATGSFVTIDGELLTQQVQTNALQGLAIVANGVSTGPLNDRGALPQLRVRGMSTLNGPQDPLIILDNFPFEGDISNINPHDIDRITILKDAAASSIWGARAGNGVIVITTKKATYGQRLQVDLNSNLKVNPIPDLFYTPRMSTAELIDFERFLFAHEYRFSDTDHRDRPPFSTAYELLFRHRDAELSSPDLQSALDRLATMDVRRAYTDQFFHRGLNQQHALNLRSGTDRHAWNTAVSYDRNRGTLDDRYERLSLRYGTTTKLAAPLTLTTGINVAWNRTASGKPTFGSIRQANVGLPAYTTFTDGDGAPLPFYPDYRQSYVDEMASNPKLLDWNYYPSEDWRHDRTLTTLLHGQADAGLAYRFMPGLAAEVKYQLHIQQRDNRNDRTVDSYFARNLINSFYQPETDTYGIPTGGILNHSTTRMLTHNYRGQLNLDRTWGTHAFTAIAGGELRRVDRNTESGRLYGYDSGLLTTTPVNYLMQYRNLVSNRQQTVPYLDVLSAGTNRYVSVYANGAYTFARKYTASVSARRDASNIFGARTNNRWTPLWSAGLAWTANREAFYDLPWLPLLKLRATYGYSGNIDPSLSAVTTLMYTYTSIYTQTPVAQVDRFYNPDLRWEKVRQINVAADFGFRGDRVTGSLEFYVKHCSDLYGPSPIDYTAGIGLATVTKNVADMRARGVDVQLNSINTTGQARWTTTLNASQYTDRITDYHLGEIPVSNLVNSDGAVLELAGKPVHPILSYAWAGLDPQTGDPRGFGLDGLPTTDYNYLTSGATPEDLIFHGSTDPRYFGSLGNTLSWRNLSLSVYIGYRLGHHFRRSTISYAALYGQLEGHGDYQLRWKQSGDEQRTHVPSLTYPLDGNRDSFYQRSEVTVGRADNIRLQYINLSYRYQKAQVYVNCNNLGLLWSANDHGIDPDYGSNSIPPGMDIALGIRLSL